VAYTVGRAVELYNKKKEKFEEITEKIMGIDHSWTSSTKKYIALYESLVGTMEV